MLSPCPAPCSLLAWQAKPIVVSAAIIAVARVIVDSLHGIIVVVRCNNSIAATNARG